MRRWPERVRRVTAHSASPSPPLPVWAPRRKDGQGSVYGTDAVGRRSRRRTSAPEGEPVFIQVNITHSDHSIEEFMALEDEFTRLTEGQRTIERAIACVGTDDPSLRVLIAIFPDAEAAARNSALPGTDQVAQKVMAMSKGEPQFINLNVVSDRSF